MAMNKVSGESVGGEKPGFYEFFGWVTRNFARNPVSETRWLETKTYNSLQLVYRKY